MKFSAIVSVAFAAMATALPTASEESKTVVVTAPGVELLPLTSVNPSEAVKRELTARAKGKIICFDHVSLGSNIHRMEYNRHQLSIRSYFEVIRPRTCRRIACDGGDGVALCNDSSSTTWSVDPKMIASYVYDIWVECARGQGAGQLFDTRGFNVIIQRMGCGARQEWPVGQSVPR